MYYFLATILMFTLAMYIPMSPASAPVFAAEVLGIMGVTVLGILYCFQVNKKGDGKHFLDRMICISWPIAIKQFLLVILVFCVAYAFVSTVASEEVAATFLEQQTGVGVILMLLLEIWFFWRISIHIRWISSRG